MRAAKVDRNSTEILDALRAVGASVQSLAMVGSGCPDALVGFRGTDFKLEIKHPDRKYKQKADPEQRQAKWQAEWKGQPTITVRSIAEALSAIGAQ